MSSGMSYEEACETEVTREQAKREIAKHQIEGGFEQFLEDVGDKPTYKGQEILNWLGY